VTRFSATRTTPSFVLTPMAVDPSWRQGTRGLERAGRRWRRAREGGGRGRDQGRDARPRPGRAGDGGRPVSDAESSRRCRAASRRARGGGQERCRARAAPIARRRRPRPPANRRHPPPTTYLDRLDRVFDLEEAAFGGKGVDAAVVLGAREKHGVRAVGAAEDRAVLQGCGRVSAARGSGCVSRERPRNCATTRLARHSHRSPARPPPGAIAPGLVGPPRPPARAPAGGRRTVRRTWRWCASRARTRAPSPGLAGVAGGCRQTAVGGGASGRARFPAPTRRAPPHQPHKSPCPPRVAALPPALAAPPSSLNASVAARRALSAARARNVSAPPKLPTRAAKAAPRAALAPGAARARRAASARTRAEAVLGRAKGNKSACARRLPAAAAPPALQRTIITQ
jgi:hypothetical protein